MAIRTRLLQAGLSTQALASTAEREEEALSVPEPQDAVEEPGQAYLTPAPHAAAQAWQFRRTSSVHRALARTDVLRMNSGYGNRYVNRVLKAARSAPGRSAEAEPAVGAPDDRYEREADRAAARLSGKIGMTASAASQPAGGARVDGRPLPDPLRRTMEQAFGADLGAVRVHSDAGSARLNDRLQSHAFTVGRDIFLGAGAFSPQTARGQALLAHETAHVVQQSGTAAERTRAGLSAAPPGAVQRLLKGTASMLRREGGEPSADEAAPKGLLGVFGFGKSLYAQILDALDDYEELEWKYEHGETKRKGGFYLGKLTDIVKLIDRWIEKTDQQGEGLSGARAATKRDRALRQVRDIVDREIGVVRRHGAPDTRYTRVRRRGFLVDPQEKAPRPR